METQIKISDLVKVPNKRVKCTSYRGNKYCYEYYEICTHVKSLEPHVVIPLTQFINIVENVYLNVLKNDTFKKELAKMVNELLHELILKDVVKSDNKNTITEFIFAMDNFTAKLLRLILQYIHNQYSQFK